jgi:hypothetical protein
MLFPKYALEDLTIGSGSIVGKGNIEKFFNHISMHKDVEDRSLAELAPSYEVVATYLVHMLEARFVNLNPFMQQMFLKLHDIEDSKKKDFILETLHREFRDATIEARKVFECYNMLGSRVNVVGTTKEDVKVPIPCKLVGLHESLEIFFDWICPENLFDERSEHKSVHKGSLMRDGGVIFSPSSWEPQEEGMMSIAARFSPQLRNQGMSIWRGRSQTTEGDAC